MVFFLNALLMVCSFLSDSMTSFAEKIGLDVFSSLGTPQDFFVFVFALVCFSSLGTPCSRALPILSSFSYISSSLSFRLSLWLGFRLALP
jgi:hypothetical protein